MNGDTAITLSDPAAAAAWRRQFPAHAGAVVVVAGTFEILQPGNLAALRRAAALGGALVAVVEDDGAAPSQAARGGSVYTLPDRLACVSLLKPVAAVAPGRPAEARALFESLAPFTWVGRPLPGDGPIPETAARLAADTVAVPFLPGCRTADIGAAARDGKTPVPLPPLFAESGPVPGTGPAPAATVNGCFDVLHTGHYRFLREAAALAGPVTLLINSDASIRRYKGAARPVFPYPFRRAALLAMRAVAEVYPFDEDEPLALLAVLKPALHIKGGSREPARVKHEEDLLQSWGGRVAFCPLVEGFSTSAYLAQTRHRSDRP
jgi:rfaE bifunctional protein nucleotidyltransferase chain/domain